MKDGPDRDTQQDAPVWTRSEPESPCVNICLIHPEERICLGCFRTGEEISRWSRFTSDERAQILAELPGRAGRVRKRRGGRHARLKQNRET